MTELTGNATGGNINAPSTLPRLTAAELDALGKDANWDSRYGERAIKELKALREQNQILAQTVIDFGETDVQLREQNAALVAALEEISNRLYVGELRMDGHVIALPETALAVHMREIATKALARVRGAE